MKRFLAVFMSIVLVFVSSMPFYTSGAVPDSLPVFRLHNMSNFTSESFYNGFGGHPWAYVLLYEQSTNKYYLYMITNIVEYANKNSVLLSVGSGTTTAYPYYIFKQNHIGGASRGFIFYPTVQMQGGVNYCNIDCANYSSYTNEVWGGMLQNIKLTGGNFWGSPELNLGTRDIIASTHNLVMCKANHTHSIATCTASQDCDIVFYGSESYFLSLFESGYKPYLLPHTTPIEPPTQPPTTTGGNGNGNDSGTADEQLKVSNNILTNIKNIVQQIFDLPGKIADAIGGFFKNLFDWLMDGLKYLFIPSENWDPFGPIKNFFQEKFVFITQISDVVNTVYSLNYFESENTAPKMEITVYGHTASIIDWSFYKQYRELFHSLVTVLCWLGFIFHTYKRIPSFIQGFQDYTSPQAAPPRLSK